MMRKGLLILAILLVPAVVLGFTRSDFAVWSVQHSAAADSAAYADSAGTLTDGAVTTPKLTTIEDLTISGPGFRIFADSLVFSSAWAGYTMWDNFGTDPESTWVSCPLITDTSDSTNTMIFPQIYTHINWAGFGAGQGNAPILIGPMYGPTASPYKEGGFYAQRRGHNANTPGFWWFMVRLTTPP